MYRTIYGYVWENFLGKSADWYKLTIIGFLFINPMIMVTLGSTILGWLIIAEFIFTLAFALKCYPLQSGGLLAIETVVLGLTNPEAVWIEVNHNTQVIFLLVFMVSAINFMRDLIGELFTKIFLSIESKVKLSVLFCFSAAFLSAFLDALTVIAVFITVMTGFYNIYHKFESANPGKDGEFVLEKLRSFLRSLTMHAAIGTMLGGVMTIVGEPQNLIIGHIAKWQFVDFFINMSHITIPVFIFGIFLCVLLEKSGKFGYGEELPKEVKKVLEDSVSKIPENQKVKLFFQLVMAIFLVIALGFHIAEVGLIGLTILVILTAFNGITDEHTIGKSFSESLPFVSLLVVFFVIVSMIHETHLFRPIIEFVMTFDASHQPLVMFTATGILSAISDNVFVAGIFANEVKALYESALISREQFEHLLVAINVGTNVPSIATPNGQAAFLFLLTSGLAPLIRLSYGKMLYMALPYTVVLSLVAFLALHVS